MSALKNIIKSSLKAFDIGIIRYDALQTLLKNEPIGQRARDDIEFLFTLPNDSAAQLIKWLDKSKSQLRQDLFVLSQLNFKTKGFFVETNV